MNPNEFTIHKWIKKLVLVTTDIMIILYRAIKRESVKQ